MIFESFSLFLILFNMVFRKISIDYDFICEITFPTMKEFLIGTVSVYLKYIYFLCKRISIQHLWCHNCSNDITIQKNILWYINSNFLSSFMQPLYTIWSSNHHFSTPTIKKISVKKLFWAKYLPLCFRS